MIDRILVAYARIRAAWRERQSEREFAKAMRKRREEAGWFTTIALICFSLPACGPSPATRTALDEVRALDAQCSSELDALDFAPGPNLDGEARLQAVLAGCRDRAAAFCTAHHLTHEITEVCP